MPIPKKAINETLLSQLGELLSFPCYFFLFHGILGRHFFHSIKKGTSGRLLQLQAGGPWIKISGSPSIFNFAVCYYQRDMDFLSPGYRFIGSATLSIKAITPLIHTHSAPLTPERKLAHLSDWIRSQRLIDRSPTCKTKNLKKDLCLGLKSLYLSKSPLRPGVEVRIPSYPPGPSSPPSFVRSFSF